MTNYLIVFALEAEAKVIIKKIKQKKKFLLKNSFYYQGYLANRYITLLITGMGPKNVYDQINEILKLVKFHTIISMGISGALNREYKAKDFFIQSKLIYKSNSKSIDLEQLSLTKNKIYNMEISDSTGLTVDRIIEDPIEKEKLHKTADLIDMESYHLFMLAQKKNIPFISIRSVLDEANEQLPPFSVITDDFGKIIPFTFLKELVKNPKLIIDLIKIAGKMKVIQNRFYEILIKILS